MNNRTEEPVTPGDVLDGKYRVERVLGAGGMGIVVQARHITLNRLVAIKFMRAEALRDGESVARFQREAHAAASLQSEYSARVQDTGHLEDGAPYMVMEFLTGRDLGQLLEESGPVATTFAVDLVLQACEALAEAHGRGIVHRDMKPRNLFLTQRMDGRPHLKVLDFGLAKNVERTADHALTRTTAVMGSPQYMSPEQMRASRDVDQRTDIWSLGVCLYELVTGVVPFDAPTVPMLCALVLKDAPRAPRDVNSAIPAALSAAILRCLEKEPSGRFASVEGLAHSLEPFGSDASRGAAARVGHVLATTRPFEPEVRSPPTHAPPPQSSAQHVAASAHSTSAHDATLAHSDTKTAASFDSKPLRETSSRATMKRLAAGLVGACFVGVAIAVVALLRAHEPHAPSAAATAVPPPAVEVAVVPEAVSPLATSPTSADAGSSTTMGALSVAPIATMPVRATAPRRPNVGAHAAAGIAPPIATAAAQIPPPAVIAPPAPAPSTTAKKDFGKEM